MPVVRPITGTNRKAIDVEERHLAELQMLPQRQAPLRPPEGQTHRIERPGAALFDGVGRVFGRDLGHGADDGQVEAPPAAPECLHPRLQVLHQIPTGEAADPLQRGPAPDQPGPAGEDSVGGVFGQHHAAIEERLAVAEGVALADDGLLDRLHVGQPAVRKQLADDLAQKLRVADLVVGVAGLDEPHLRP
jgi:hypothetical protein